MRMAACTGQSAPCLQLELNASAVLIIAVAVTCVMVSAPTHAVIEHVPSRRKKSVGEERRKGREERRRGRKERKGGEGRKGRERRNFT